MDILNSPLPTLTASILIAPDRVVGRFRENLLDRPFIQDETTFPLASRRMRDVGDAKLIYSRSPVLDHAHSPTQ